MADGTGIAWTDATWNPVVGCSVVSPGCTHCYAMKEAHRLAQMRGTPGAEKVAAKYEGLTRLVNGKPIWNGIVRLAEDALDQPLRWKRPRRIFVNSMSDLFHESFSQELIYRISYVMLKANWHIYQVLTKRAERMAGVWLTSLHCEWLREEIGNACLAHENIRGMFRHVWLGVSAEDQQRTDERIPWLLQTPAAVRWVSYEPALGSLDLRRWLCCNTTRRAQGTSGPVVIERRAGIDWVVCGGESGAGARPCDVDWFQSIIDQCRATMGGARCFVKQLGADPRCFMPPWDNVDDGRMRLKHSKGGDLEEWPCDLRVREYPEVA